MAGDTRAMIADMLRQELGVLKQKSAKYIPTGIIEPAIKALGELHYSIINMQLCNKAGKTAAGAAMMANIFWENDSDYFGYDAFKEWPFRDVSGNMIRRARIVGTKENVAEGGPIYTEIKKWWPAGRYEILKHGHSYPKEYKTDTGWYIDVLSHDQSPEQHEGPLLSLCWIDEPASPKILGAVLSRFAKGGVLLLSQTPIGAGMMLDVLDDLREKGSKIIDIYGNIHENCSETGKLNSKGTMRGLMSPDEIRRYVANTPNGEEEARLEGKASHKSGKVYPEFDRALHIAQYDLLHPSVADWNKYMAFDPHRSFYPAMLWYALTPADEVVIWNEWPTVEGTGKYYDEMRNRERCDYTIAEFAKIMRIYDLESSGFKIITRAIDPRFAQGTKGNWDGSTQGMIEKFALEQINFEMPPFERIDVQSQVIRSLLRVDKGYNEKPRLFVMPHCRNFIRSIERHYYQESSETEAEDYKDFLDCLRYGLSLSGTTWKPTVKVGKQIKLAPSHDIYVKTVKKPWDEIKEL